MWIKPTKYKSDVEPPHHTNVKFTGMERDNEIDYSSRPVQFSRLVSESSHLFKSSRYHDVPSNRAKTKFQVSCPVTNQSGQRVAPFCYAIEIDRSPIVRDRLSSDVNKHTPLAYSLSIHPPLVITNLLPCKGRFELMHTVNRAVMWSEDLESGQEVSVHSVGLDAPLLLFLNIGFAKTPVGEGALVHHGSDPPPNIRGKLLCRFLSTVFSKLSQSIMFPRQFCKVNW
jgi:hypothetical protein